MIPEDKSQAMGFRADETVLREGAVYLNYRILQNHSEEFVDFYWVIDTADGNTLGLSEGYPTQEDCEDDLTRILGSL